MVIRKALQKDFEKQLDIFKNAREFMSKNGNPEQWKNFWPPIDLVQEDINLGRSYVVVDDNDEVLATYALMEGIDPTYVNIEGEWLSSEPYLTIHRLASSMKVRGMFLTIMEELKKLNINIRIDTHANNKQMIKQIEKAGFKFCGIIYVYDGTPRNAYEFLSVY